jgi:DNA polymerase
LDLLSIRGNNTPELHKNQGKFVMTEQERILKSLALAGVEWELSAPSGARPASADEKARPKSAGQPAADGAFSVPRPAAPMSNARILEIAKERAKDGDIIAAIAGFTEHPLFGGARNTVLPRLVSAPGGAGAARLLVITDAPSLDDDNSGMILSGAAGELFDKMLSAIGLGRDDVSITPLVFWRPAGGRPPSADELSFCRPFVDRIMENSAAKKILTLGAVAAREIIGATLPRDHGKEFDNKIPIYKPDFILSNPNVKRDVWEALRKL